MKPDIRTVLINQITSADITNCRSSYEDVEDLVQSLDSTGQQMPIGVTVGQGGGFSLVYGFRRLHAAKQLGWDSIDARVIEHGSEADLLILNLQENVTRKNLTPIEEAHAIQRIMDAGKSEPEIRSALGFTKTLVTQRLALLGMSDAIQGALSEDGISVGQARAINEAPEEHQERLIDLAKSGATTKSIRQESDLLNDLAHSSFIQQEDYATAPESEEIQIDPGTGEILSPASDVIEDTASLDPSIKASLLDIFATLLDNPDDLQQVAIAVKSVDFGALMTKDAVALDNALNIVNEASTYDTWGAYARKSKR
jgi:ParB/RepB/Spo0J family partition protein